MTNIQTLWFDISLLNAWKKFHEWNEHYCIFNFQKDSIHYYWIDLGSLLKIFDSIQKMALKTLWMKYCIYEKNTHYSFEHKIILSWQVYLFQCTSPRQLSQNVNFWRCFLSEGSQHADEKELNVRALGHKPDRHRRTGLVRLIAMKAEGSQHPPGGGSSDVMALPALSVLQIDRSDSH